MTSTFRNILTGCALLAAVNVFAADPTLKVHDVNINVNEKAQTLTVLMDLNMKDFKVGRNGEAIYTPVILSENGNDSVVLPSFTVCGRSRYYYYMREGLLDSGTERIYRSGSKEQVRINETVPLKEWMLHNGTVEVRQQQATCCNGPVPVPGNSPFGNLLIARLHSPVPQLEYDYVFAPPMEAKPVEKSEEGRAFVTFVVNRTELNPTYMNNPAEIQKIINSIDKVKGDSDAVITEVHIRGFASPEGPYENNVRLAMGRTETLSKYVNSLYQFSPGIMTTSYVPEDWQGLRSYVADSMNYNLTDRKGLLSVIDGSLPFDARDAALKTQFPQDYKVILNEIYPWLRHSDYAVKYRIKVFTDIKDLMRLYRTDPTKLRAVDFYTIAQQFPTGSAEYFRVMEKAAEVYPDDPMINLNVANLYLMKGDLDNAQDALFMAGRSPEANYARGVLAAKRGEYSEAEKWFKLAEEGGLPEAKVYVRQIEDARATNPVDILVKTTRK